MDEKSLHQKKMSDLVVLMRGRLLEETRTTGFYGYKHIGEYTELIWPVQLREVVIAIVKNCPNTVDCTTHNPCGTIGGYTVDVFKKLYPKMPVHREFCNACQRFIDFFEIKQGELL